ncbi:hypothetical protein SLITO_v1c07350 [Spiroplasma litorale]|uniref:Lipoprotein n=1 Tax=Spiroplasma litorale TaxID=216942 RepID=A0A0K1W216_9MOLU|nr:hypothetical protein [Spiroplasma litorale]AKX34360.1 hypothetical protein SLITO_v1c07350 [Spiroplasma litorale]
MKKLINLLGSLLLASTPLAYVVSCGNGSKKDTDDNNNNGGNNGSNPSSPLTPTQQDMIDGASMLSKLIIGGRHENLNYNVNEILSLFLSPEPLSLKLPMTYKYNNENINLSTDLNKYKNYLAPNIEKMNNGKNATMAASYVMGMYENDFYKNIINGDASNENSMSYYFNDTFSKEGNQGFNKPGSDNAMGFAAGLGNNIDLSNVESRKNLSWAIQDTGALSNYLLANGFDGANPSDTNGQSGEVSKPSASTGGTNGSGYLYYNSLLLMQKAKKSAYYPGFDIKNKMKDVDYMSYTDRPDEVITRKYSSSIYTSNKEKMKEFNSTGGMILRTSGDNKANAYISSIASMFDNFSETSNGASLLSEFSNILLPIIHTKKQPGLFETYPLTQGLGFSLITKIWEGLESLKKDEDVFTKHSTILTNDIKEKINGLDKAIVPIKGSSFPYVNVEELGIESLYKKQERDKKNPGTNAKDIFEIINSICENASKQNDQERKSFTEDLFTSSKSVFKKAYSMLIKYMSEEVWNNAVNSDNYSGGLNLLKLGSNIYEMFANEDYRNITDELMEKYKDYTNLSQLTTSERSEFTKKLGYSNSKYEENSILYKLFKGFTDENVVGQKQFRSLIEGFRNYLSEDMQLSHENVFQYLVNKKYWDVSDVKIDTTHNTQVNGKMEFTLSYTGKGDSTSSASKQTTKVNVPDKFNPYQTKLDYQEEHISQIKSKLDNEKIKNSGKVLGQSQLKLTNDNLLSYDGLGNYQDYTDVNNKYKVVWENISENTESPYWVITGINCYNEKGEEFFNIY